MRPLLLLPLLALVLDACKQPDPPPITGPWSDKFERTAIGADYFATADVYVVKAGVLSVKNAYNHPLWLRKRLPDDAVIELDCWSDSAIGDIKVEAWADGESAARDKGAYTSSGYVFIFGGWSNSKSLLARGNEHGTDLVSRVDVKVERGRRYHWKIVRKGGHIDWFIDDMTTPFLAYDDPQPLRGPGHAYFGFNDWEAPLSFANLSIAPL